MSQIPPSTQQQQLDKTIQQPITNTTTTTTTTPPKPKTYREFFPVLDGVRTLLTLWVVLFHTAWHVAMFLPREQFTIWFDEIPTLITSGLNGVDWFFVLTGFLLAQPIFAGQRTGTWFEFVWLRLSRIYPMYIFALLLFCLGMQHMNSIPVLTWDAHSTDVLKPLIDAQYPPGIDSPGIPTLCEKTWANLLFINNFLPFGGCCGWTWSLAIQAHFIFIFPIILHYFGTGRKFIWFCTFMTGVWMIVRYLLLVGLVQRYPIDPPPVYIYSMDYIEQFFILFNVWYSSTFQRIGCCFAGVILAWVHVFKPKWTTTFHQNKFASYLITFCACWALALSVHIRFTTTTLRPFLFSVGGIGHVGAISILMYCLINKLGPLQYLTPILSHKFFTHCAYPSYCVYLIHSFIIIWVFRNEPFTPRADFNSSHLTIAFIVVLFITYSISYLATRFIEEPIKGLMRKFVDPTPSSSATTTTTPITTQNPKAD